MIEKITIILTRDNVFHHRNQGMLISSVVNSHEGLRLAAQILIAIVDHKTALFLSGGSTPKLLYESLAKDENFSPGAAGLIDERYGNPMHANSNEKMIQSTGLLNSLKKSGIPVYLTLQSGKSREAVAESYDQKLRELFTIYPKSIGILGIGPDGHIAGIAPNRTDFINPLFEKKNHISTFSLSDHDVTSGESKSDDQAFDLAQAKMPSSLVASFDDPAGPFKARITMTFLGLSMLDLLIVLVFGDEKKKALEMMFDTGPVEEIPARFLTQPDIAVKTLVITDQNI